MFSFFKNNKSADIPVKDKVWKKESGAIQGLLMMAMMRLQQQKPALVVAFFEAEKEKLAAFMAANQIQFKELTELSSAEDMGGLNIILVHAHPIFGSTVSGLLASAAERMDRTVYFPSHYPTTAQEDKLLAHLSDLGYATFNFCLSFEDPTLQVFGSEKMLPLLEKLGLDETEAIEHDLVSRSLKNARKKLDEKVKREVQAKSPAEWFALNIKP